VFVRESYELFIVGALTSRKIIVEVTDNSISYEVPSINTLGRLIRVMQDPPDLRAPYLLIFGHPGCGKTRFIHELLEASRTSLVSSLAGDKVAIQPILPGVDLTLWAVVPVSFKSKTEISIAESEIFRTNPESAIALRIAFQWLDHGEANFKDFMQKVVSGIFSLPDFPELFSLIRNQTKRDRILLVIDESMRIMTENLISTDQHSQFIKDLVGLQNANLLVLFTGLKCGVFLQLKSSSNRPVYSMMLEPLKSKAVYHFPDAMLVCLKKSRSEYTDFYFYQSIRMALWSASGGIPRVIEFIRSVLRKQDSSTDLMTVLRETSVMYSDRYLESIKLSKSSMFAGTILALIGRPIPIMFPGVVTSDLVARENIEELRARVKSVSDSMRTYEYNRERYIKQEINDGLQRLQLDEFVCEGVL